MCTTAELSPLSARQKITESEPSNLATPYRHVVRELDNQELPCQVDLEVVVNWVRVHGRLPVELDRVGIHLDQVNMHRHVGRWLVTADGHLDFTLWEKRTNFRHCATIIA